MTRLSDEELKRISTSADCASYYASIHMSRELIDRRALDLSSEDREALQVFRDSPHIVKQERVECSDPQCGDSTWDHYCDAMDKTIPEVNRALIVLDKLLTAARSE